MKCPHCQKLDTKVLDSRIIENDRAIRRRRSCEECGHRFTTYERPEIADFYVIKKDNTREPYSRDKMEYGMQSACIKRPVRAEDLQGAIKAIEEDFATRAEVSSVDIGNRVMEELKKLDDVAYIRFASVYRSFKDVTEFEKELNDLKK